MSADASSLLFSKFFLQKLSANVRMVLASADSSMDLDKHANMAPKVTEVATLPVTAVSNTRFDCTDNSEVKQLREVVAHLADLIASLTT